MADKNFLSNTDAAKLLAMADRSKPYEIDPIKGHVPKWPTKEDSYAMLYAVDHHATHVTLQCYGGDMVFGIKYYDGHDETGEFFIGPLGDRTPFVPCGVFLKEKIRVSLQENKVVEESDANRLN